MNINQFILANNLKPADAIILNKKFMGMVDHFVIFIGIDYSRPRFVANFTKGVKEIADEEIEEQLKKYVPKKIERYPGNEITRYEAVNRALSRLNEKAYNYIANNCEHYKNFVHYGKQYSKQIDTVGNLFTSTGGLMAVGGLLASKNKTRNWGAILLILGLTLKYFAERNNNSQ